jgi:aspartate/methionine/tyrosine aminotransferase
VRRSFVDLLRFVSPKGGGMAFMHYEFETNSTEVADWLRKEHSVFILAGDCFGMDHFSLLGIGSEAEYLRVGLERIRQALTHRFDL